MSIHRHQFIILMLFCHYLPAVASQLTSSCITTWLLTKPYEVTADLILTYKNICGLLDIRMEDYFQLQSTKDDCTIT